MDVDRVLPALRFMMEVDHTYYPFELVLADAALRQMRLVGWLSLGIDSEKFWAGPILVRTECRLEIQNPNGISRNALRCCLDGFMWPRNLASAILTRLVDEQIGERSGGVELLSHFPVDRKRNEKGGVSDEIVSMVEVLDAFNSRLSGRVLSHLYSWSQPVGVLPLFLMIERFDRFHNLWDAHPQLAWLVAQKAFVEDLICEELQSQMKQLLSLGPLALLQWLELPRRRGMLRFLRRIPFDFSPVLWDRLNGLRQLVEEGRVMMFGNQLGPADVSDLVSLSSAGPCRVSHFTNTIVKSILE